LLLTRPNSRFIFVINLSEFKVYLCLAIRNYLEDYTYHLYIVSSLYRLIVISSHRHIVSALYRLIVISSHRYIVSSLYRLIVISSHRYIVS